MEPIASNINIFSYNLDMIKCKFSYLFDFELLGTHLESTVWKNRYQVFLYAYSLLVRQ